MSIIRPYLPLLAAALLLASLAACKEKQNPVKPTVAAASRPA